MAETSRHESWLGLSAMLLKDRTRMKGLQTRSCSSKRRYWARMRTSSALRVKI